MRRINNKRRWRRTTERETQPDGLDFTDFMFVEWGTGLWGFASAWSRAGQEPDWSTELSDFEGFERVRSLLQEFSHLLQWTQVAALHLIHRRLHKAPLRLEKKTEVLIVTRNAPVASNSLAGLRRPNFWEVFWIRRFLFMHTKFKVLTSVGVCPSRVRDPSFSAVRSLSWLLICSRAWVRRLLRPPLNSWKPVRTTGCMGDKSHLYINKSERRS